MNFAILIESFPATYAYGYCETLINNQHHINCIFFYGEGVLNSNEPTWQQFITQHKITAYACIKSVEAKQIKTNRIGTAGLATFLVSAIQSNQVVQFKQDGSMIGAQTHKTTATQKKSLLITLKQCSENEVQLGIDMALAASAFEFNQSVLFTKESVSLLASATEETDFQKQIKAWPWYDIHHVFASKEDITTHHLQTEKLILPITLLEKEEIETLIKKQDIILGY